MKHCQQIIEIPKAYSQPISHPEARAAIQRAFRNLGLLRATGVSADPWRESVRRGVRIHSNNFILCEHVGNYC